MAWIAAYAGATRDLCGATLAAVRECMGLTLPQWEAVTLCPTWTLALIESGLQHPSADLQLRVHMFCDDLISTPSTLH